ncbi:MAG: hypothetical protein H6Q66_960 [Firmicutes bacterium]|nr:hypothetical protein [Bacillota bacterium]
MRWLYLIIVLPVIILIYLFIKSLAAPENLGLKNGKLLELPASANAISSQTSDPGKRVEPFVFKENLEKTKETITKIAIAQGATLLKKEHSYFHFVYKAPIIPFRDDVEFFFDETTNLVHFRSASRVGYSDFGVNRDRYEKIKKMYDNSQ